jgi:chemotaxis protein MotB
VAATEQQVSMLAQQLASARQSAEDVIAQHMADTAHLRDAATSEAANLRAQLIAAQATAEFEREAAESAHQQLAGSEQAAAASLAALEAQLRSSETALQSERAACVALQLELATSVQTAADNAESLKQELAAAQTKAATHEARVAELAAELAAVRQARDEAASVLTALQSDPPSEVVMAGSNGTGQWQEVEARLESLMHNLRQRAVPPPSPNMGSWQTEAHASSPSADVAASTQEGFAVQGMGAAGPTSSIGVPSAVALTVAFEAAQVHVMDLHTRLDAATARAATESATLMQQLAEALQREAALRSRLDDLGSKAATEAASLQQQFEDACVRVDELQVCMMSCARDIQEVVYLLCRSRGVTKAWPGGCAMGGCGDGGDGGTKGYRDPRVAFFFVKYRQCTSQHSRTGVA